MSTAITKQTNDLRALLTTDAARSQIAAALPKYMNVDRQIRVLLNSVNNTPKLLQCTQASLLDAFMRCNATGLEPDGIHAHLVPYGQTCQLIIGYKGILRMMFNTGLISTVEANVIHAHDYFDPQSYRFVEWWLRDDLPDVFESGKVLGAFCKITMRDSSYTGAKMSESQINAIRDKAQAKKGPWVDHWEEMAKKTLVRRASKMCPMSSEMHQLVYSDDDMPVMEPPEPIQRLSVSDSVMGDIQSDNVEEQPQ